MEVDACLSSNSLLSLARACVWRLSLQAPVRDSKAVVYGGSLFFRFLHSSLFANSSPPPHPLVSFHTHSAMPSSPPLCSPPLSSLSLAPSHLNPHEDSPTVRGLGTVAAHGISGAAAPRERFESAARRGDSPGSQNLDGHRHLAAPRLRRCLTTA